MSQKWFNNIDLQQNELQNGVIQNLPSDPSSGKSGQIYYNTTQKRYRYYDGTSWVNITADAVQIIAGDGLTSSGTNPLTISLGTPSASGSGSNTYGSNDVTAESHTHQIKLPDASESAKGVIELATDAEATEGTDTTRAINAKQLETARKNAEVSITAGNGLTGGGTGHSLSVAMGTPSTVNQTSTNSTTATSHTHKLEFAAVNSPAASGNEISFIDTVSQGADGGISATKKTVRSASTTQTGVVQLATQDEVNTGTDTAKVITPATLGKGKASGVASLDRKGKILTSQLPDYLLGQVMYGGNASAISTTGTTVSPSDSLKAKTGIPETSIVIVNSDISKERATYGWQDMEGVYFICQANGTFADIDFETGDWIISTGSAWEKIDNTDSIVDYSQKSVQTFTGDGNQTIFDFTHSLGSDVVVQVYLTGQAVGSDTVDELIMVDTHTLNNKVKLVFATAPTASQTFKVVIIG